MRFALALFLLTIASTPAAHAERYILAYRGAVFGIVDLGDVTLDIQADATAYEVTATLRSSPLMSLFERTRLSAQAEGQIDADGSVRWSSYALDHHYARKHRTVSMRTTSEGVEAQIVPNYRLWGDPPTSDAQRRASRDPLSSLVAMSVQAARTHACAGDYPTFDGRFHYRLELRGGEMRRVDDDGFKGYALRCRLRYVPVAGFEPADGGRRNRIPEGEIWFALIDGAPIAPPIRASSPFAIGRAGLHLTRLQTPMVEVGDAERT
jgi:hypothetical protein